MRALQHTTHLACIGCIRMQECSCLRPFHARPERCAQKAARLCPGRSHHQHVHTWFFMLRRS